MFLTRYAVYRRLACGAIAALLVVLGLFALSRLPMNYLPSITYPLIKVEIRWEGAAPAEIEKNIAQPVERVIATVDRLERIESSSLEGRYSLDVHFKYGANVDVAFQDVTAALARVRNLPNTVAAPYAYKADPTQIPVMQLAISSDRWDPATLRDWAENWFLDRLMAVSGVAGTDIVGGLVREVQILLDPVAIEKHQLVLDDIVSKIAAENIELTGGRVTVGPKEIIARTMGEVTGTDELGRIVVASEGVQRVLLADVATLVDGHADKRVSARFNGGEAVRISVLKSAEANIVAVADAVNRQLDSLRPALPEGITLGYVEDQSVYVRQALTGVSSAAIAAAALLIVVIYLFLGSLRQVAVMLIALPLTLIVNFALMKVAGFSLNIFSLGGLVVAIGVVLDNSVVVLENTTRLHRNSPQQDIRITTLIATTEVSPALIAATLSFLALFVPFLLVPGLTSLLFQELILVIAGIVVVSLLVALTVTPLLATLFIGSAKKIEAESLFERFFNRVADGYAVILDQAVRWRLLVVALFFMILGGAILLSGRLGGEFLPMIDDGQVMIRLEMPTGAAVAETDRTLQRIEERLADDPLISTLFTFSGGRVMGMTTNEIAHRGEIYIQLVPRSERDLSTGEYAADLRRRLNSLQPPGGRAMARQVPIRGIPGIRSSDVIVKVRGPDLNKLAELTEATTRLVGAVEGFHNVRGGVDLNKPEFQIHIDRMKAAALEVSVADVSRSLRTMITGTVPSRLRDGEQYYDIRILMPREQLTGQRDLENLVISSRGGVPVRLRDIAMVDLQSGPLEILREDQLKQITVEADIADNDLAGAVQRLEEALGKAQLPPGYSYDLGGSAEMMLGMKRAVLAVLVFSLFFAFIVLTVQFNSFRLPLVILTSVPVCFAGVVFLMYQVALPLGATVIIGVLVVVAATVNDGVLLLTYAGDIRKQEQLPPGIAVVKAARIRFRPRVMTTVTTITGFMPLALNLSDGGDMLQPMAVAAIGGLGMEMLVALFLMPCLYVLAAGRSAVQHPVP